MTSRVFLVVVIGLYPEKVVSPMRIEMSSNSERFRK